MPSDAPLAQKSNGMLWGLLGTLAVFATGYFYVAPQVERLETTRLTAAALAADKQGLETTINEVTALSAKLDENPAALQQLALAVPDRPALDELMVSLQSIASAAGVVVPTLQPAGEGQASGGTGVTLTVRGSYSGVRLFLELLGQNLRPLKVTELAISATSDVTGASLVNASLSLVAARAGGHPPAGEAGKSETSQSVNQSTNQPPAGGPDGR